MELSKKERDASPGTGRAPAGGWNPLVPELDVTDLQASLRFWCDLLGFEIAYDRPAAKFAYLQREGAQIMLCEVNGEWVTGPLERPFGRGVNFQIAVQNLDPVVGALKEAGWPVFREPFEAWYRMGDQEGGSREILVLDPDGYLVRLAQSLGKRPVARAG